MNYQMNIKAQEDLKLTPVQKERYDALVAMHQLVCYMNDESAYMRWIFLVPDEASAYDLAEIAMEEEEFSDVVKLFKRLWLEYASKNDGLYIGNMTY